jgi:hypothetical protein
MAELIEKITTLDDAVLRNTVGLRLNFHAFDDLSDDPEDWHEAEVAADFAHRFAASELQYNAIDYVFDQRAWPQTRFSDGTFAAWYGSLELETTFHETVYHWQRLLADTPTLIDRKADQPLSHIRTVFGVQCQSSLVELRHQAEAFPFLLSKQSYQETQKVGAKLSEEGFPGLLFLSARTDHGSNLAVFNKNVLRFPWHQGDYLYQMAPDHWDEVKVTQYPDGQCVDVITLESDLFELS